MKKQTSKRQNKKIFSKYFKKYWYLFLLGVIIVIAVDWFQLYVPLYFGNIVDLYQEYSQSKITFSVLKTGVFNYILKVFLVIVGVTILRVLWRFCFFLNARNIEEKIRNEMFLHATKLSQDFYSKNKVGQIMPYFTNDLGSIRMFFAVGLMFGIDFLFLGGFTLYRMFKISWFLTLISSIPLFLMSILFYLIEKPLERRYKEVQDSFQDMMDYSQESISGISVIKAFTLQKLDRIRFRNKTIKLYEDNVKFVKLRTIFDATIHFILTAVVLTVIGLGSIVALGLLSIPKITSGEIVTFISLYWTLTWPIQAVVEFISTLTQARASAKRISKFMDEKITVKDSIDVLDIPVEDIKPTIRVSNLTFSYPDEKDQKPKLKNINFEIKEGEKVGILGRTGCGKSTLIDLFLRLHNVSKNSIFIGGYDIMKLPIKTVRKTISLVPQDNFLFSDTISNNIGFGFEDIENELVERVSKQAGVYENIIEFPDKFKTVLGERGITISGGQKQRISIARALAIDPKILILDDSVSAVDTKTEELIIDNLIRERQNKTTILIAHRITTIRKMDKIILMDKGKILDVGSHDELIKRSKEYLDLVNLQALESEM